MKNSRVLLSLRDLLIDFKSASLLGKVWRFGVVLLTIIAHIFIVYLTIDVGVSTRWYWGVAVGFIFVTLLSGFWDNVLGSYEEVK